MVVGVDEEKEEEEEEGEGEEKPAKKMRRKLLGAAGWLSRPARPAEDKSMSSPRSAWSLLEWSEPREAEKIFFIRGK